MKYLKIFGVSVVLGVMVNFVVSWATLKEFCTPGSSHPIIDVFPTDCFGWPVQLEAMSFTFMQGTLNINTLVWIAFLWIALTVIFYFRSKRQ